ncbi:hypothetical protein FOA52_003271 [Chlamydomonas sp. UWO 241]|nr:hypothetical protein FOA52_003271 [Chlamydomonas sp. UWO 241]
MASAAPRRAPDAPANEDDKLDIMDKYAAFVFDLDGTLWTGDTLIAGAQEVVDLLRFLGKKIYFVTNNSTKSRAGYMAKFQALNLKAHTSEVYGSAYAAAQYLRSKWYRKKVYVIGEAGLMEEMKAAGITAIGGPDDADKKFNTSTCPEVVVDKD